MLANTLGFEVSDVRSALAQLEGEGIVLRGFFTAQRGEEELCDRRILARIHRATIAHLRREIEPVPASTFLRFLFSWQHLSSESQLEGPNGILEVVEQLQGFETAAMAWENEILRSRIRNYDATDLDNLCLAGEVVWGRWTRRESLAEVPSRRPGLTRTAVLGLGMRQDMGWLLADRRDPQTSDQKEGRKMRALSGADANAFPGPDEGALSGADENALLVAARDVLAFLRRRGASFFPEIMAGTRQLGSEVEEALWQLVAAGFVTADSFAALRSLVSGEARRNERSARKRRQPRTTREGRWSLLEPLIPHSAIRNPQLGEQRARQYLRRYGMVFREILLRETSAPPWRDLLGVLRRFEARGEIRGGRFVAGFVGEQFALPEAVEALRAMRRTAARGQFLKVSACDPLNLVGILTPGPRVTAVSGNWVIYRDGVPVAAVDGGETRILSQVEAEERPVLERLLDQRPASAFDPALAARPRLPRKLS